MFLYHLTLCLIFAAPDNQTITSNTTENSSINADPTKSKEISFLVKNKGKWDDDIKKVYQTFKIKLIGDLSRKLEIKEFPLAITNLLLDNNDFSFEQALQKSKDFTQDKAMQSISDTAINNLYDIGSIYSFFNSSIDSELQDKLQVVLDQTKQNSSNIDNILEKIYIKTGTLESSLYNTYSTFILKQMRAIISHLKPTKTAQNSSETKIIKIEKNKVEPAENNFLYDIKYNNERFIAKKDNQPLGNKNRFYNKTNLTKSNICSKKDSFNICNIKDFKTSPMKSLHPEFWNQYGKELGIFHKKNSAVVIKNLHNTAGGQSKLIANLKNMSLLEYQYCYSNGDVGRSNVLFDGKQKEIFWIDTSLMSYSEDEYINHIDYYSPSGMKKTRRDAFINFIGDLNHIFYLSLSLGFNVDPKTQEQIINTQTDNLKSFYEGYISSISHDTIDEVHNVLAGYEFYTYYIQDYLKDTIAPDFRSKILQELTAWKGVFPTQKKLQELKKSFNDQYSQLLVLYKNIAPKPLEKESNNALITQYKKLFDDYKNIAPPKLKFEDDLAQLINQVNDPVKKTASFQSNYKSFISSYEKNSSYKSQTEPRTGGEQAELKKESEQYKEKQIKTFNAILTQIGVLKDLYSQILFAKEQYKDLIDFDQKQNKYQIDPQYVTKFVDTLYSKLQTINS